ncbi:circadian clock-controlled protein [Harpegnathos saltator]|nr:circadian clock-controlled protein [Harpegnathos saltator]
MSQWKMAPTKATFTAILLAVATISAATALEEIPKFLQICDASMETEKFEQCAIESISKLQPYLQTGVEKYNIPSLEPLKLKRLKFNPATGLRMQAKNLNIYQASNFKINKLKFNLDNLHLQLDVFLPNILIEAQYDINGKILLLPVYGSGNLHVNASNCIGACTIQGKRYTDSEGVEKVHISEFGMKITVGKATFKIDNLFNGDKVLGDIINSAINNNLDLFLIELLPLLEDVLSNAFNHTANKIVEHFSFAQLFPNYPENRTGSGRLRQ